MPLISLRSVSLSYGAPPLLDAVDLDIDAGERVCLLGRNGAGKSTLLRIIDGEVQPDSGERRVGQGVRIARLAQEAPPGGDQSVLDVVAGGLGELGALVGEYYRLSHHLGADSSGETADGDQTAALERMAVIQQRLEADGGWEIEQRAERVISRLGLDADARYATLSGGLRRRVMLACALVSEPDLLLLDEPTNHLDIETIEWLEEFLLGFRASLLFITHDRRFLRRIATRILELDRGRLTDWPGDYDNYLRRREERLNAEAKERERFDKKLAEEEVWIRQGIKARRTRNEGRVRALKALRDERRARREGPGQARIRLDAAERSGKLVIEAEGVSFDWGGEPVIAGLDTLILRGDRVGIIGPNGAGKSTLLKLLLGELEPTSGRIRRGTNLQVAYFDQLRDQLDPNKSVRDNVAGGSDKVEVGGSVKHVLSYLKDFLFTPERAQQPVSALSGGERNRLLLARLFTQPANLLVLDEPTNDLDAETLELLEDLLTDFPGTLLLVSHDRDLLDNVVTSTLVLEGNGRVGDYVGGYSDWLRQRPASQGKPAGKGESRPGSLPGSQSQSKSQARPNSKPSPSTDAGATLAAKSRKPSAKLGYKDQRELEQLPQRIEALEAEQEALHQRMADPAIYQGDGSAVAAAKARLVEVEAELAASYARWESLEAAQA
jgi:ATP-binding cassette subfamily F protein uup